MYYPRPEQYEEVLIILHDKTVRYVTCENCYYPVLFIHAIGEVDDACKNELGKVIMSNVHLVQIVYQKNQEIDRYVKTDFQYIQDKSSNANDVDSSFSNQSSTNSQELTNLLQQLVGMRFEDERLRCPKWKQNQSIDEYIILLGDWIDQSKLQNVLKFQQKYEALQESQNDQLVNMLSNFLLMVRPQINDLNRKFKETILNYLRQRFGRNSLYRSIESWSEQEKLSHDANAMENFLDQFKLMIQRCDLNGLKIPEPVQVAMHLSKLSVDQTTFKNITSAIDDVGDNNALKSSISTIRKFCLLHSNI